MNAGANAETDVRATRPVRLGRQVSRPRDRDGTCARLGPATTTVLWLARGDSPPWGRAGEGGRPSSWPRRVAAGVGRVQPASLPIAGREHARTHPPRSSPCGVLGPVGCGPYRTWPLPPQELVRCGAGAVSCHARAVLAVAAPCELRSTSTSWFCSILQICQLRPRVAGAQLLVPMPSVQGQA